MKFPNRFTPTYVGTSFVFDLGVHIESVHPHVCGDFKQEAQEVDWEDGSPPRMWGLHAHRTQRSLRIRFTPTYVGTSPNQTPASPKA